MKKILIQLDTDAHPSTFDRVVAVDSEVDELFSYGGVTPDNVTSLVHGAMFTRGGDGLKNTAIFIGGSNVADGESLLKKVQSVFFGPVRVSILMDSNGSNTTAAAAVLAAGKHVDLSQTTALLLGGTGPVGQRAAQILTSLGATVRIGTRSAARAEATCEAVRLKVEGANVSAHETGTPDGLTTAAEGVEVIIATGAAGIQLLSAEQRSQLGSLKVAIDLNAVPPVGIEGVEVFDKAVEQNGVFCYGAIGVGGTKMKIHKAAVQRLFNANDLLLDTAAVFEIGQNL
ncbi:MAG: bifunctional NADP-dependent methylenetetrahydromethanopterin dehydrogenase/methylenetetrahydrofolate dehydrogenase [Rhodopirellula sp.]|nr:bifunctional NADP-dependent methylenetetrahydromethanopterin dehydrogenase/methylenetetrahydrofolate dehydrogenase [Rhodopirellula sp.]